MSSLPLPGRVFEEPLDFGGAHLGHGGTLALAYHLGRLPQTGSNPFDLPVVEALERFLHHSGWSRTNLDD